MGRRKVPKRIRVLLIGQGAREAALAKAIAKDAELYSICEVRNPMIENLSAHMQLVYSSSVEEIVDFAKSIAPEAVMIGPESLLAAGIVDALARESIWAFGPTRECARLEWDKAYGRNILQSCMPSANVKNTLAKSIQEIDNFFSNSEFDVAVKPVGLTGGKAVKVMGQQLSSRFEAMSYAKDCLARYEAPVLLEERIRGVEYTLHAIVSKEQIAFMPATYDYSPRYDNDLGTNTGGMGSYLDKTAFLPFMTQADYSLACNALIRVWDCLKHRGLTYCGVLQGQFFQTISGIKVCEFACRLGDSEGVNLLDGLESSWVELMLAVKNNKGIENMLKFRPESSVAVCVVPPGYAEEPCDDQSFSLESKTMQESGAEFYPGSIYSEGNHFRTTKSRSGAVLGRGSTIDKARSVAYAGITAIAGLEYRRDIASTEDILNQRRKLACS